MSSGVSVVVSETASVPELSGLNLGLRLGLGLGGIHLGRRRGGPVPTQHHEVLAAHLQSSPCKGSGLGG